MQETALYDVARFYIFEEGGLVQSPGNGGWVLELFFALCALRLFASALRLAWDTLATLRFLILYAILHAPCQFNHSPFGLTALFSVARDPLFYLFLRDASSAPLFSLS